MPSLTFRNKTLNSQGLPPPLHHHHPPASFALSTLNLLTQHNPTFKQNPDTASLLLFPLLSSLPFSRSLSLSSSPVFSRSLSCPHPPPPPAFPPSSLSPSPSPSSPPPPILPPSHSGTKTALSLLAAHLVRGGGVRGHRSPGPEHPNPNSPDERATGLLFPVTDADETFDKSTEGWLLVPSSPAPTPQAPPPRQPSPGWAPRTFAEMKFGAPQAANSRPPA